VGEGVGGSGPAGEFRMRYTLAGLFGGSIWRVYLAGPFGGSIWRVHLACLFGGSFWQVYLAGLLGGSAKDWRVCSKGKQVEKFKRQKKKVKIMAKRGKHAFNIL
jgi:hypothetical protein